ncbi:hypothetical protein [Erwinia sorbitola]|uniref:Uncharacterized protein n=1 Tax=Erwinia sorbitola TaxID=2681984 RepID=A0ABW9R6Y8_9GAMM|nr:hypothetical protein [Erwinia sorbitola]MTD25839.1 hypothetical protein [Erwinia sorbitola]
MINETDLQWIFGRPVNLNDDLLDAVLKFTLAFSYAENRLMGGNSSTRNAGVYADKLINDHGFRLDLHPNYFRRRYNSEVGFEQRLHELCNGDNISLAQITNTFSSIDASPQDVAEALFRVCIRLRNNLFHGKKWSYMLSGQERNLNMATNFIVDVLRASGE